MDHAELYTKIWLENQEFSDIQYFHKTHEQPPDFLVDDRIAVEVRRLNWMTGDDNQGLESIELPLAGNIWDVLENAEAPPNNCKVYVSCDYLFSTHPPKEVVRREVEHVAIQHVRDHQKHPSKQRVCTSPTLRTRLWTEFTLHHNSKRH